MISITGAIFKTVVKSHNPANNNSNKTTKGSHDSENQNNASRNKHEKADARRAREQKAAQ